jgi:hypothetical protein
MLIIPEQQDKDQMNWVKLISNYSITALVIFNTFTIFVIINNESIIIIIYLIILVIYLTQTKIYTRSNSYQIRTKLAPNSQ